MKKKQSLVYHSH